MINLKTYEEFVVNELRSGELFNPKRNKPTQFDYKKHPELASEMFDLIQTAYAEIGGHSKVKSPDDVFADPDWNFWEGIDIHGTEDFDVVMFGSKTNYGIKYAGVGHDGTRDAKLAYLNSRGKDLKNLGFYVEVSGKVADILIKKYGVPVVNDKDIIGKVLGKPIDYKGENPDDSNAAGDGWYIRTIAGHSHTKIMLGRPKI